MFVYGFSFINNRARVTGARFAQMRNSLYETTIGRRQLVNYLQHGWGVKQRTVAPNAGVFFGRAKAVCSWPPSLILSLRKIKESRNSHQEISVRGKEGGGREREGVGGGGEGEGSGWHASTPQLFRSQYGGYVSSNIHEPDENVYNAIY